MSEELRPVLGSVSTMLPNGRWVPAQPLPYYNRKQWLRSLLCKLGKHLPGIESDGWFCSVCLKQLKETSDE